MTLAAQRPHQIQTMYNKLFKSGLSPKTIKNIHGVLHRALDQAVAVGYLKTNPCQGVKLPRIEKPDIKPLMDDEVNQFLDAIEGNEYEMLCTVTMYTGLRQSEVMGLTWDCVDLKNGTIYVDKQLVHEKKKGGIYKFAPPKNDKPRRIAPAPTVMKLLEAVRLRQKERRLKAGPLWDNNMNLVFTNEIGGHYAHTTIAHNFNRTVEAPKPPTVYKAWLRYRAQHGICCTMYELRHTFVSIIKRKMDTATIKRLVGHSKAMDTLKVYGHDVDGELQIAAQQVNDIFNAILNEKV